MPDTPDLARVATLLGDPTRVRMLSALMEGRALTATELSLEGGVSASTASSHLTRLTEAGLLSITRQGRHRYFRIASPEVAGAIEGLMCIAPPRTTPATRPGPQDERLRRIRICYDHLAGEVAVRLLERLKKKGVFAGDGVSLKLTPPGEAWCGNLGIDLALLRSARRRLCRPCLDWSERRFHLAGALGSALLDRMLSLRYLRRVPGSRGITILPAGETFLDQLKVASRP
jgi:DNA-binding transcriptional ArsR family regulator